MSFRIEENWYAIDLLQVVEVAAFPQQITPMPLWPKNFLGIFNLRDKLVTVVATESKAKPFLLILKHHQEPVGVAVDEVSMVTVTSDLLPQVGGSQTTLTIADKTFKPVHSLVDLLPTGSLPVN